MFYVGFYMISRRVSSPMFEYWNAFVILYILTILTSISVYKAVKNKHKHWIVSSIILLMAVVLFVLSNLYIQNSPIIPSSVNEKWITM